MSPPNARFGLLWSATAISNLGDGVRATALPLLATELTRNPALVAGVAVAERIPWLVFLLPGGAWADRYDRRRLRVALDLTRAAVVVLLAVLVATDNVTIAAVYAAAALLASAESIVDGASVALVPSLVGEDELERAGGRLAAAELTMESLIGPPLGGILFATALWVPFGVDAITFAVAAALAAAIPGTFRPRPRDGPVEPMLASIRSGARWLWHQPLLRNLALISAALGTAAFVGSSILVLFAREILGLDAVGFGVLLVPAALGGVAGSMLAPLLRDRPLAVVLTTAVTVAGIADIAIAFSSSAPLVAALLAANYGAVLVWNVLTLALRQRLIPDELLGRVGSSYRFVAFVGMPIGAILGGTFASLIGLREAFALAGVMTLGVALVVPGAVSASPLRPPDASDPSTSSEADRVPLPSDLPATGIGRADLAPAEPEHGAEAAHVEVDVDER